MISVENDCVGTGRTGRTLVKDIRFWRKPCSELVQYVEQGIWSSCFCNGLLEDVHMYHCVRKYIAIMIIDEA